MELQLYPPGNPPYIDSASCDDSHWCAALTIDSLECTGAFALCNTNCEEPANVAFIQKNGVPTGGPAPQDSDLQYLYTQQRNAPYEPRRHDQDPHVRRAGARRW